MLLLGRIALCWNLSRLRVYRHWGAKTAVDFTPSRHVHSGGTAFFIHVISHAINLGMHIRVLFRHAIVSDGEKCMHPVPPRSSRCPKCSQRVDFTLCQLSAKTVEPCLRDCAPSCALATCVCLCVRACVCACFSHTGTKEALLTPCWGRSAR